VSMAMARGNVLRVSTDPVVGNIPGRVPLRSAHQKDVVDPSSAMIIPLGRAHTSDGNRACNRTVRVFDGWQRFDVRLSYRRTEQVSTADGKYAATAFVCAARYVPVAGHMDGRDSV